MSRRIECSDIEGDTDSGCQQMTIRLWYINKIDKKFDLTLSYEKEGLLIGDGSAFH